MHAATPNFIRHQVISSIVKQAQEITALNRFARDNLQSYVIERQADILRNLVTQVVSLPKKYKEYEEKEAKSLNHDNMMNVRKLFNSKSPKKSLHSTRKPSKSHLKRTTKTETSCEKPGLSRYMSQTKQLPYKIEQYPIQIEKFREHKLRQYAERQEQTKYIKPSQLKCPNKNIVFDYDGNIQFGLQLKSNNLLMPFLKAQVSAQNVHSNMDQAQRCRQNTFVIDNTKKKQAITRSPDRKEKDKMRKSTVRIDASALNLIESCFKVQQIECFQKETFDKTAKKQEQRKRRKTQELFNMGSSLVRSKTSYTAERIQARSFFAKQIKERISVEDQYLKQSLIGSACSIFVKLPKKQIKSTIVNEKSSQIKKENVFILPTRKNRTIPRIFSGNTFRIDTIRQLQLKSTY